MIESFEPRSLKHFDLKVKAGDDTDALRPKIEAILSPLQAGVRTPHLVGRGGLLRCAGAARNPDRPRLQRHPEARSRRPRGGRLVREEGQGEVKLIIQPDDGLAPLLKAVRSAKKTIDIVIFRFDRTGAREGARGGRRARRRRPRADRAHQPRRREEPAQARADAARRRGDGRAHGRRSAALSRQDDDRGRHAARLRLQLHEARHREEPQLRDRHARQAAREGSRRRSSRPTARASPTPRATTTSS